MIIYNITKKLFIIKNEAGKITKVYGGPLATQAFQKKQNTLFNPRNNNYDSIKLLPEQQN